MKVALVGYGYWGRRVARAIARVSRLDSIVEPHPGRMAEAAAAWGPWGTHVTSNIADGLAGADAAWICVPVEHHYDVITHALDLNCHVLCEKPLVDDPVEAMRLVTRAQAADRLLMAGHLSRYTPEAEALPTAPYFLRTIRRNTDASLSDGNVLWGLGPHDAAMILRAMGREPDDIIVCEGSPHRVEAKMRWTDVALDSPFATNRYATMELDWLATHRYRHLSYEWLAEGPSEHDRVLVDSLAETGEPRGDIAEPLLLEAADFIRLCSDRDGRMEKADEALAVTNLLHRLERTMTP